jgi:hypothetical protein
MEQIARTPRAFSTVEIAAMTVSDKKIAFVSAVAGSKAAPISVTYSATIGYRLEVNAAVTAAGPSATNSPELFRSLAA